MNFIRTIIDRYIVYIFFFVMFFTVLSSRAETKQSKGYYLIDSLDLNQLSELDKVLIDSSLNNFYNCTTDTCKIAAISNIVEESWDQNVWPKYNAWIKDYVEQRIKEATDSTLTVKLRKYLAGALNNIGYLKNSIGETEEAIFFFEKSISIYKEVKDNAGLASSLVNLGHIYDNQGLLPEALNCYYQSLEIQEKLNNQAGIATALNGIGYLYYKQDEKESALHHYLQSLEIRKQIKDEYGISTCLNNLGLLYKDDGNYEASKKYYLECLSIDKKLNNKKGMSTSYINLGSVSEKQLMLEEALNYYRDGLKIVSEIEDKNGIANALNNVANVLLKKGAIDEAETNAQKAFIIAKELNYPKTTRNIAETLAQLYEEKKQWSRALEFYQLYSLMKDSINNEETQRTTIHSNYKYRYQKRMIADSIKNLESSKLKEAELQLIKTEKESITLLAEKRSQQNLFLLIGLLLILIFLGFIYSRLLVIRGQKKLISIQKDRLTLNNKTIESTNHELKNRNIEITDSIAYAEKIQGTLLRSRDDASLLLKDSFVSYFPKDVISGDFYWITNHGDYVYIAIGDCTGHGVPGALLTMLGISMLNEILSSAVDDLKPSEILEELRSKILIELSSKDGDYITDGMDVALVRLEKGSNQLMFSGAFRPMLLIRNGECELVKGDRQSIGHNYKKENFTDCTFNLEQDDCFYLYSDGYADQFGGESNKKFRNKSLVNLLLSNNGLMMTQQKEELERNLFKWKGERKQTDDIVVVGVRV